MKDGLSAPCFVPRLDNGPATVVACRLQSDSPADPPPVMEGGESRGSTLSVYTDKTNVIRLAPTTTSESLPDAVITDTNGLKMAASTRKANAHTRRAVPKACRATRIAPMLTRN